MIRRDATGPAVEPAWILISQVEHARVSAELAQHWGAGGVQPLDPRDELLATIAHHDDGWADWEVRPSIDPANGRPYDFMEMPLDEALPIWDRSIAVAQRLAGPLGGWLVASHFAVLLRRGRDAHPHPAGYVELADAWLADNDSRRARWLAEWQQLDQAHNTAALADRGLAQLQMFDALSLWLCCAWRDAPKRIATPEGPELTLTPVAAAAGAPSNLADAQQQTIAVRPWPFAVSEVAIKAAGQSVPVGFYTDPSELAAAASQVVRLDWIMKPD
ncbi:MAG: DUF3891 family protein [Pirellulales bacterium]